VNPQEGTFDGGPSKTGIWGTLTVSRSSKVKKRSKPLNFQHSKERIQIHTPWHVIGSVVNRNRKNTGGNRGRGKKIRKLKRKIYNKGTSCPESAPKRGKRNEVKKKRKTKRKPPYANQGEDGTREFINQLTKGGYRIRRQKTGRLEQ